MTTQIHPKSLPITPGWSHIGPRPIHRKSVHPRDVSKAFRVTLNRLPSRRIVKLRNKLAQGKADSNDLIIGLLDVSLAVRPPKVFTKTNDNFNKTKVIK